MSNMTLKEVQELLDKIKQEREESKQRTDDRYINQNVAVRNLSKDPNWIKANAESNRKKAKDPEWQKNHQEMIKKRSQNSEWQINVVEAAKKRSQNLEWQINVVEAAKKRSQNLEWQKNHQEMIKKRSQNSEWKKKVAEAGRQSAIKKKKPIKTPKGIFDSRRNAAKALEIREGALAGLMKKFPDQYYYIDEQGNRVEPGKYKK